jgi:hypothetical protein
MQEKSQIIHPQTSLEYLSCSTIDQLLHDLESPKELYKRALSTKFFSKITNSWITRFEAAKLVVRWYDQSHITPEIQNKIKKELKKIKPNKRDSELLAIHKSIWGRDATVLWHNVIIGNRGQKFVNELRQNQDTLQDKKFELYSWCFLVACWLHDLAECQLDVPYDCISGQKKDWQKDFEEYITSQILNELNINPILIPIITSIIKKEEAWGLVLKNEEIEQFQKSAHRTKEIIESAKYSKYLSQRKTRKKHGNGYRSIPNKIIELLIAPNLAITHDVENNLKTRNNL